jgi:hypothetical protein
MNGATPEAAIRQRAYAIWEAEGRPQGHEWSHWAQASEEILKAPMSAAVAPTAKPRKTTKGRIRAALKSAISA